MRNILCIVLLGLWSVVASATPTEITVRVLSKGAKFIGTSMGGAEIQLIDAESGEVLAKGLTEGSTGDTRRIMNTPLDRGGVRATEGAAAFRATLELDEPRLIQLVARGPQSKPDSAVTVTSSQWVVPGRHMTSGDGWLVEIPGLVVEVMEPQKNSNIRTGQSVDITADVTMMCGCPLSPGGLWDAGEFEITAMIYHDGEMVDELTLPFAGQQSRFSRAYSPPGPGQYEAIVFAHQTTNGNTGLYKTAFTVSGSD